MSTNHALAERFAELSGRPVPDLLLPTKVFSASTGMRQPTVRPLVDLFARAAEKLESDLFGTQPVLDATSRIGLGWPQRRWAGTQAPRCPYASTGHGLH